MKYAVIAAGEGSRLSQEGITVPKPLVNVNGEMLIDRLLRIFADNDPHEMIVICNDRTALTGQHLTDIQNNGLQGRPIPLRFIVKSTQSSMHSLFELSKYLDNEPFCLTTVDTVFHENEFARYVEYFSGLANNGNAEGVMGVTDYIDDESPLYVGTDADMNITGFYDEPHDCRFISGGIYGFTPGVLQTLRACVERGENRMRNFQRALVADRRKLKAYPFSKILDIDHAADIPKAETFLST